VKVNDEEAKATIKSKMKETAAHPINVIETFAIALNVASSQLSIRVPEGTSTGEFLYKQIVINELTPTILDSMIIGENTVKVTIPTTMVTMKISSDLLDFFKIGDNQMPSCPPGTRKSKNAVYNEKYERSCDKCPNGTFSDVIDAKECTKFKACQPGEYIAFSGTARRDRYCMKCEGYSWSTTTNAKKCQVRNKRCEPGYYVIKNTTHCTTCGNVGPYSCEECALGKFSTSVNAKACQPWRNCEEEDMVTTVTGTTITDNKCVNCGPGQCPNELLHCLPGTYIKQGLINGTVGFKCQPCPTGFFQDQNNATLCLRWKACGIEEFISNPGTATSDQECSFCEHLQAGQLQDTTDASKCKIFEPSMVGAKFPSDFVLVAVLALLCCYCGGKVNKRPNFIKTAAMLELEDEEKRQKREEELLKKLLTKRKAKNKKKEKFKDKIRRLYNEKREKIHKYFEAAKEKKKTSNLHFSH